MKMHVAIVDYCGTTLHVTERQRKPADDSVGGGVVEANGGRTRQLAELMRSVRERTAQ